MARTERVLSVCLLQLASQVSLTDLLVFAHGIPPEPLQGQRHSHPHPANTDRIPQLTVTSPGSLPCSQVGLEVSCAPSPSHVLPSA